MSQIVEEGKADIANMKEEFLDDESLHIVLQYFFESIRKMKNIDLSKKSMVRVIEYTLNKGLTTKGETIKLKGNEEDRMSMLLGTALEAWLVLQGRRYKDLQDNNNKPQGDKDNVLTNKENPATTDDSQSPN